MVMAVVEELIHLVVMENVINQLIHHVHEQRLILSCLDGCDVLDLL